MPDETVTVPQNTEDEVKAPLSGEEGMRAHDAFAASLTEQQLSAEETPTAPGSNNADNPNAVTATAVDHSVEGIAKAAYAKLADALQWKGDFPAWEAISDRARELYIGAVGRIQEAKANVAAVKVVIGEEAAAFQKAAEERIKAAEAAAQPKTDFEKFVVEALTE